MTYTCNIGKFHIIYRQVRKEKPIEGSLYVTYTIRIIPTGGMGLRIAGASFVLDANELKDTFPKTAITKLLEDLILAAKDPDVFIYSCAKQGYFDKKGYKKIKDYSKLVNFAVRHGNTLKRAVLSDMVHPWLEELQRFYQEDQ